MTAFDDGLWARLVDEHEANRVSLGSAAKPTSRRPGLLGVGGVAAVCAAGLLAAVLSLAGGASNAFAGWTPTPTGGRQPGSRPSRRTAPRTCPIPGCR